MINKEQRASAYNCVLGECLKRIVWFGNAKPNFPEEQ